MFLDEIVQNLNESDCKNMTLITKWGCDGFQQLQFKQKFSNSNDSDANIFQSFLVPLQFVCDDPNNKKVSWRNPQTTDNTNNYYTNRRVFLGPKLSTEITAWI